MTQEMLLEVQIKSFKDVVLIAVLTIFISGCSTSGVSKDGNGSDQTKETETTQSDAKQGDSKADDQKVEIRKETAQILEGIKKFESDKVKHYTKNERDESDIFYYEKYALAELMVRADHGKTYDYIRNLKDSDKTGAEYPIMGDKESFIKALNKLNSEDLYKKYPDLIIANYSNYEPIYVYESLDKAEKDPENPLLSLEIEDYDVTGESRARFFPVYLKLANVVNVKTQYEPKDVDENLGKGELDTWRSKQKYYLNDEPVGTPDYLSKEHLRYVYDGTYTLKVDWVDMGKLKVGKPDASGYEFSKVIPDKGTPFSGTVHIGNEDNLKDGDLKLPGAQIEKSGKSMNNINIMNGLISAGDSVMSIETQHELIKDKLDKIAP